MKHKLLSLFVVLFATTALWAGNTITYTATEKLSGHNSSLNVGKTTFGPVITSHTFSNGIGTITCEGEISTIGWDAFTNCSGLISITIPNSVTTIAVNAFFGCSGLASVIIPNSVTTIEGSAFSGCSGLTSVTIGNSVTTIWGSAFEGCSGLKKTNYTGTIADWCKIMIEDSWSNPMRYSQNFFINDVEVKDLVIPEDVESIGRYAFYGCSGLTSVTIPNSVTSIGSGAFYHVNNIVYNGTATGSPWGAKWMNGYVDGYLVYTDATKTTLVVCSTAAKGKIVIPSSVTTIGDMAFEWCSGLTSIDIPNSVITIGYAAFYYCTGLTSVTIPSSVTTIGDMAFEYCSGLTSVTIPNSVTSIGSGAFYNCSGLTSITIPNSVTTIEVATFYNCSGLTSVTIPKSVTKIGINAFDGVINIVYNGTATGAPWGAKCVNGYVDDYLVYTDTTKTTLVGCSTAATGNVVVPMSVDTIKTNAFSGCNKLDSVYIENYFTERANAAIPSSVKIKVVNDLTVEQTSRCICSVSVQMTMSAGLSDYYDEIGLTTSTSASATCYPINASGKFCFSMQPNQTLRYDIYAKKDGQKVCRNYITVSTKTPSLSCSSSATQTTITLSNISVSTDTSVYSLSKGIYYNYKRYEVDENNKVVITGIVPNTKCTLQVYGCYNGNYYYGAEKYITTQAIAPTLTVTESPTCVYAKGSYTHGDATILGTSVACTTTGSSVTGDEGLMTGLKPNTSYSFTYSVDTKEGGTYTATKTITTPALTLTTLVPKVVSSGKVVVAASTNISDMETNVGFEWRKYNAPPELPSSRAQAILYNGQMEGILHNLSLEYWKVRAYYEAADGTCYYGEWATFDPSQPAFFEPTVHTYALVTDPTANKVQMRGYVMTGTDDVTEQGFEYWFKGAKAPRRVASATPDSVYRVQASGQVMTAVLEDLAYSTTYTCRAYAIAGGKTYYGEEVQFLTPEDPRPIYTLYVMAGENGSVNTDVSGQYREGETITLTATGEQGFRFVQWSDGNTDNPRQLTITANTELVAFFELADGLEWLTVDNAQCKVKKMIIDNQLFIFRGDKIYNAVGVLVK